MITFNEYLKESLDSKPAKWRVINNSVYGFNINGLEYRVNIDEVDPEDNEYPVEVDFGLLSGGQVDHGMTDTGNQFKVLATVVDVIKDFAKKYDPPGFIFTADKPTGEAGEKKKSLSRAKVYLRMVKRYFNPSKWWIDVDDRQLDVRFFISKKD